MSEYKIGGVRLNSRALLAPMAGISDRAYRELCVSFGAGYCVSEMVSSKALSFKDKKSEELMKTSDKEQSKAVRRDCKGGCRSQPRARNGKNPQGLGRGQH